MSIAKKFKIIAENEQKVYDAGKRAEYDAFWDAFQENGSKTKYTAAFAGTGWNAECLKPKYKVVPEAGVYGTLRMFAFCNVFGDPIDFREIKDKFDFSNIDSAGGMFSDAKINHITIDLSNAGKLDDTFSSPYRYSGCNYLHITLSDKNTFSNTFAYNSALTDIEIDGVIAANGFNVQWSWKMTKASIISIINALSATTSGLSVTLSATAVNNAFTTDEWNTLIATKPNWTISLV
jgi:hypothetical protein